MILRQKILLHTLREKKRYVAYEVMSDKDINQQDIKEAILSTYEKFFGRIALLQSNMKFLYPKEKKGIIKVNHKFVDYIKGVFILINQISNQQVIVRSIGVSGILNKAKERYSI